MSLSVLQAAAQHPERTALVSYGREVSFGKLADDVRIAIRYLLAQRVRPGVPVGLVGENLPSSLALLYAMVELGVPAAMLHPKMPALEQERWLKEIGAAPRKVTAEVDLKEWAEALGSAVVVPDDDRPLAIVRTAGSSGRPKGVVLSRRAFVAAAEASAANLGWRDDDRWLLSLPTAHVGGLSIVTRCLLARRPVVVRRLERFDAAEVARILEEDRVTLLSLVPTTLRRLVDLDGYRPPAYLRVVLVGGAAAPAELLARAADRGWPVLATYGLTEACSQVATQRYRDLGRRDPARFTDCGEPVDGMEVRIRDGAIEVRGPSLMSGYLPQDESPFDVEGWLATGDLGFLDDAGRLHVTGRRDDVIVTGGENVHPEEVERVLEAHPAIDAACVFGVDDPEWGQAVAAALASSAPPPDAELARFCAERLAPHQRPRRIAWLETLPRTVVGKLDRREAARAAAPHLRDLVRDE